MPRRRAGIGSAVRHPRSRGAPAGWPPDDRTRRMAEARETAPGAAIRGAGRSPAHGTREPLTRDVSAGYRLGQRVAGLALRAAARARDFRSASHWYQAARSWLALKMDE